MSTPLNSSPLNSRGTATGGSNFWKILAIVVVGIIALSILWPLVRGLFWLGVIGLAIYGGYILLRSSNSKTGPPRY